MPLKAAPSRTRREARNIAGRFRGGKLAPVMAVPFLGGEGGMVTQSVTVELDPVAGRLITPVTAEVVSVFVPVQAMDHITDPEAQYAGLTEVVRQKLLSGDPVFGLEAETEISKRLGVMPRRVSGEFRVSTVPRLAHNAAVNFLRLRKYAYATLVEASNATMTPALIGATALERLNGVLDPDDHINGKVALDFTVSDLPVRGIGIAHAAAQRPEFRVDTDLRDATTLPGDPARVVAKATSFSTDNNIVMEVDDSAVPNAAVYAELDAAAAGGVRLTDFYNAERRDRIVRQMRQVIDNNPLDGEDIVLRWVHGLNIEPDRYPFVIYESQHLLGQTYTQAGDGEGILAETSVTRLAQRINFTIPVPTTELGGVVITFVTVKPDETLGQQPHPILSDVWGAINHVSEGMEIDPVAVTMREVFGGVPQAQENTVAFYTGLNELRRAYINYGFSRETDPTTVEAKTAIWQLDVPASVNPENVIYPEDIPHYPFFDETAEVVTYSIASTATIATPMVFGPTPVETVAILEDDPSIIDPSAE